MVSPFVMESGRARQGSLRPTVSCTFDFLMRDFFPPVGAHNFLTATKFLARDPPASPPFFPRATSAPHEKYVSERRKYFRYSKF
jgi:hypothetical protein